MSSFNDIDSDYNVDEERLKRFGDVKGFPISVRFSVDGGSISKGGVSFKSKIAHLPIDPVHALCYIYEQGVTQAFYNAWRNLALMATFNWSCNMGVRIASFCESSVLDGDSSILSYDFSGVRDKLMSVVFSQVKIHLGGIDVVDFSPVLKSSHEDDSLPNVVQIDAAPSESITIPLKPQERVFEEYVGQFKEVQDKSKMDVETYSTKKSYGSYLKSQGMYRYKDILKILSSVRAKRIIAVGDGVGISQMVCKKLGLDCYSFDSSIVATQMGAELGNTVHCQTYDQWFSTYRRKEGDVIFFSHVLVFLKDPVPSLILGGHKIVVFEQIPFCGYSTMIRMCPQAYLYASQGVSKGDLLSLSSLNPIQYVFANTYTEKLHKHAFELLDHRLIPLLNDLHFRGIKARVKNGTIISNAAFYEICCSLSHEVVSDPLLKLTYGPCHVKLGPRDRVLDILLGENHSKIPVRARVIDGPVDTNQKFSISMPGNLVFSNSMYCVHPRVKYLFPPGTKFKKPPLFLWEMEKETVAVFNEGGWVFSLPSGLSGYLSVTRFRE